MAFKPRGRLGKGKQPLLQLESLTRCELRSSKTESARRGGEAASSELLGSEVDDPVRWYTAGSDVTRIALSTPTVSIGLCSIRSSTLRACNWTRLKLRAHHPLGQW